MSICVLLLFVHYNLPFLHTLLLLLGCTSISTDSSFTLLLLVLVSLSNSMVSLSLISILGVLLSQQTLHSDLNKSDNNQNLGIITNNYQALPVALGSM